MDEPTKSLILYHGTSLHNLDSFLNTQPKMSLHRGCNKPCFCTSLSFKEAAYFALRTLSVADFESGRFSQAGVVFEFDGSGLDVSDYAYVKCPNVLRDEKEVDVFATSKLRLAAFFRYDGIRWNRTEFGIPHNANK